MKFSIFNFQFSIIVAVFLLFFFVFHTEAGILTNNLGGAPGENFTATKLFNLLNGLACWFIKFAVIAIAVMFLIYGILFLTSRGNPQAMATARKALTYGVIGAVVIFTVFTIIISVAAFIGITYPINQIISC